jgi:hypothetical protein
MCTYSAQVLLFVDSVAHDDLQSSRAVSNTFYTSRSLRGTWHLRHGNIACAQLLQRDVKN